MICSNDYDLQNEIKHLETVFCELNDYPTHIVRKTIEEERTREQQRAESNDAAEEEENDDENDNDNDNDSDDEEKVLYINLPFAGSTGENLIKKLRQDIERKSKNLKIRVTYTPTKLGSKFAIKDKTKNDDQHNVTYHVSCGNKKCNSSYVGQTRCRIIKRTTQHNNKDNASHVLIHSKATKHRRVTMKNVKILGRRYKSDFKRRISESLFIKKIKPDLNKQKDAFRLKLYN